MLLLTRTINATKQSYGAVQNFSQKQHPREHRPFPFCVLQGNLCGIINVLIEFVSTYGLMYIYVVGTFQFVW